MQQLVDLMKALVIKVYFHCQGQKRFYIVKGIPVLSPHRQRCVERYDNRIDAKCRIVYISILRSHFGVSRARHGNLYGSNVCINAAIASLDASLSV